MEQIVRAVRALQTLSPEQYKLAVNLARPDSLRPGRKRAAAAPTRRKAKGGNGRRRRRVQVEQETSE